MWENPLKYSLILKQLDVWTQLYYHSFIYLDLNSFGVCARFCSTQVKGIGFESDSPKVPVPADTYRLRGLGGKGNLPRHQFAQL